MELNKKEILQITKNKPNIQLSIGMQDQSSKVIKVYGEDGKETEYTRQRYEIGSLTKVFTASLLMKYILNYSLNLNDSIINYLPGLNPMQNYPNLIQILTHTSGYPTYLPFSKTDHLKILSKVVFGGNNPFQGTTSKEELIECLNGQRLSRKSYPYNYSNINYSIIGQVISELESISFVDIMTDWIQDELEINRTNFEANSVLEGYNFFGNQQSNWLWEKEDTTIAAGGLYSTANDLLKFAKLHHSESEDYLLLTQTKLFKATKSYDMSLGWKKCKDTSIFWHNGGTGCFSSFLGINKKTKKSIVILSNYRSFKIDTLGLMLLE